MRISNHFYNEPERMKRMETYIYNDRTPMEYAQAACDTLMRKYAPEELPPKGHFHYHQGVFLSGMEQTYHSCKNQKYRDYVKAWVDSMVSPRGRINSYDPGELDDIQPGILLYGLYKETHEDRYEKALHTLMEVLQKFPQNQEGGYWHKEKNREQMWLDGLYMAGPFCALYGKTFHRPECFDICMFQALLMEKKTKDIKTGLFYHAWDSVKERPWADPLTGRSAEFWGRSIGWVPVAVLDELECIPEDYEGRRELIRLVTELLKAVAKYQDDSGLWYQVVDKGGQAGNWLETSCTCLFAAALLKAVRLGILGKEYLQPAQKAFEGVINRLEWQGEDVIIGNICVGTGVGDYEYYCKRHVSENDLHGTGAFLLMCTQMQLASDNYKFI